MANSAVANAYGNWSNGTDPDTTLDATGQPRSQGSFQGGGFSAGTTMAQPSGSSPQGQSGAPASTSAQPPPAQSSAAATYAMPPASSFDQGGNTASTNSALAAETMSTGVDPTPGADNSQAAVTARLQAANAATPVSSAQQQYYDAQQAFTAANSGYGTTGYLGTPTQVAAQVAGGAQSSSIPQGVLDPSFYVGGANYGGGQQLGANGMVTALNPALTAGPTQLTQNHPSGYTPTTKPSDIASMLATQAWQ